MTTLTYTVNMQHAPVALDSGANSLAFNFNSGATQFGATNDRVLLGKVPNGAVITSGDFFFGSPPQDNLDFNLLLLTDGGNGTYSTYLTLTNALTAAVDAGGRFVPRPIKVDLGDDQARQYVVLALNCTSGASATASVSFGGTLEYRMDAPQFGDDFPPPSPVDFDETDDATFDAITATTLDTGQGANELYAMDQAVRTSDSPTFADVIRTAGAFSAVAMPEANQYLGVAYGDGVFLAVSIDGTNRAARSTDGGQTFSAVAMPEANQYLGVAYGDGVFLAVSIDGTNRAARSTDGGQTFSAVAMPEANSYRGVAYGDGVFLAVSNTGTNRAARAGRHWRGTRDSKINYEGVITVKESVRGLHYYSDAVLLSNLVWVSATAPASTLDGAGSVTLQTSSGSQQFKIRELRLVGGGTNFGAGGDRTITVSDGTTTWTTLPNATIEALPSDTARWGGDTEIPFDGGTVDTASAAGADITIQYAGGSTDHSGTGSLTILACLEKVA